jgi:UDP-N-acetylglucosamine transferase subunit ALG13
MKLRNVITISDVKSNDDLRTMRASVNNINDIWMFADVLEELKVHVENKVYRVDALVQMSKMARLADVRAAYLMTTRQSVPASTTENKLSKTKERWLLDSIKYMYTVSKDIDDIELYDLFQLRTNIDLSNELSVIYASDDMDNIINRHYTEHSSIQTLLHTTIITNRLFSQLLSTHTITNNQVTCFKSMYVSKVVDKLYTTRTLGELLIEITSPDNRSLNKQERPQIYMTYDSTRPKRNECYKWNGLQVFDIDLKEWVNKDSGNVYTLKRELYDILINYSWFLWIVISSSGKGIHIYTKVAPPPHLFMSLPENEYMCRYWYNINYIQKSSIILSILKDMEKMEIQDSSSSDDIFSDIFDMSPTKITGYFNSVDYDDGDLRFFDNAVSRITTGIRLTYDPVPLVNPNFLDLPVIYGFVSTHQSLFLRKSKLNVKLLSQIDEQLIENLEDIRTQNEEAIVVLSEDIKIASINDMVPLSRSNLNYISRYNICNTLASISGKDGLTVAHYLLRSKECRNENEINGFYACALTNKKTPSKLGIDILIKCGAIKKVEKVVSRALTDTFKLGIKAIIEKVISQDKEVKNNLTNLIILKDGEYLSSKSYEVMNMLRADKINIIFSPAGSGKTEWILQQASSGKRIMLVLPFISVIKNKVITDDRISSIFDVYFGTTDIRKIEYGRNAVTTFDKFSRASYDKISKMFDYIIIDESHLLFTSSYRIETTSTAVRKIKELFYVSTNDPFAAKIVLMTGTETGETFYFGNDAAVINLHKRMNQKTMDFVICDDRLDCMTRMAMICVDLLKQDYRILIPTNKGDLYTENVIGMINYLHRTPVKYGYYKRANTEQEICRMIDEDNTIGDYQIIFCSNYLSVGVDITDRSLRFASIYYGQFNGYEIEQFNARIRKTAIRSFYCIQTLDGRGFVDERLLAEPKFSLALTKDDVLNFMDDKEISTAKQEFIAQYDPMLGRISTPGFSYLNGKIQFNREEYELVMFESKYNQCMQHPVKIARELNRYGYIISINTSYDILPEAEQSELKKIGSMNAQEEKVRKHDILINTYISLIKNDRYVNEYGMEFNDVIGWIMKQPDLVIEDRTFNEYLKVYFSMMCVPEKVVVRSKEALDKMIKQARYIITKYTPDRAVDFILSFVNEEGILNDSKFKRSINLMKLIDSSDANELAVPMSIILNKMYAFVDTFEMDSRYFISPDTYKATIEQWTNVYIDNLNIKINTVYGYNKIQDQITEMLTDLASKSLTKSGVRFRYNRIPEQNSPTHLNKRTLDTMIKRMFMITKEQMGDSGLFVRKRHLVLKDVDF